MSRRNLYTPASLLVGALVVMGMAFAGQATTQASTPADASSRAMSVSSQGELPEILKDMPEDMKKNHGKYDNRLTALYEQWLDGSYNKVFNPAGSIPNPIFSPLYGPDVDMSTLTTAENEYQIDINPLNHLNAVGGSNDGMTAGVGIYRTTDGGFSWSSVDASVYGTGAACCDPAVAFGADGAVYVGVLRTASPAGQITLKSTDGGASFTQLPFLPLPDRNNIATHPTNANILYVTYFDSPSGSIRGYRSTDAGASWSPNFRISDTTPASGYQQSSQPRVHSDGTVYVGYQEYLNSSQGCAAGVRNEVSKSTDMGQTWTVTGFDIQQGGACTSQQVGRGIFCINSGGSSFRSRSHPILGLHPTNSNIVYTVYSGGELETAYTCGSATGKHGDTLFRKSTDAGATWSAPSRINTDPVGWDQYYPWVDVAPNGTIWAGWHDRREDPNNFQHRWYQSYSTDEGATWRKIDGTVGNDPVADTMSQPSTFIGDYAGIAAENDRVLPMWWDSRNGSDPYTDPYVPVQGTPTPTVTGTPPTATRTSTVTNTAIVTPSSTRTSTATPDPCQGNYLVTPTTGATIVAGTTDTGNHCDDCVTSVTLPFPFRLYDQTYNSVSVSSNGNAQFVGSLTDYTNTCLPAAGFTYTIFPYWEDLRTDTGANCPAGGCGVFTSVSGTAPNRILNIEWRAVLFSGGALANFEVRLYEGTPNRFDVIYGQNPGNTSATGGVQRDGTRFTQAFCNGTGQATTAGTMLMYSQPPCTPGTVTTPGTATTSTATRTGTAQVSPTVCPPGGGAWTSGPNFSATAVVRAVGVYFPANGRFYSMGGRSADAAGNHLLNPHEYNPANNTWTQKSAQHPDADVSNMACGVLTDAGTPYIYCAGGSAGGGTTATPRMFRYNPVTDVISAVNAPWPGNTNNDVVPGGFAVANNKLYIIGGFQINVAMTNQTWEFTPGTNAWVQKANLPVARGYVPATTIGNMIYTAGGSDYQGGALVDTAESYRFDPVANTWTAIANTPRATAETRAVTLNGEMWVLGGGRTAPNPSSMVEIYNPTSNTWRQGPAFTTARRNFPADSNGTDRIWLVGGYAPTAPTNTMEIFAGTGGVCPTPSVGTPGTSTATRTVTVMPSMTGTMMPSMTSTMMPSMTRTSTAMPSMTATMMATGTAMVTSTMMPTRTQVPCNGRVTVCHRTGNGNSHTISISCSALNAHLNHGDTLGPCASAPPPRNNPFRDVSGGDYFYEHVLDLRDAGALGGYNDGTFRPYNQATRAQLVKIVVLAFDIPLYTGSEQPFTDVPRDHPFYQYIMTARRDSIITGYADGTFRPYANVTRGQIAKIAVESARMADLSSDGPSFSDVPTNHTFFRHIETAYANGILSGYADGKFRPDADATRGQIAKIVNLATHPGTGPNRAHLDD